MSFSIGYTPSLPLAIIGTVVFTGVAGYHAFLVIRSRSWFLWLMLLAALMEASGFGLRSYTATHPKEYRKFLISYLLVILGPSILGMSLMYAFSRVVWYITPPFKRNFKTTWVPGSRIIKKLFKIAYLASFILEWVGAGSIIGSYATPTSTDPTTPNIQAAGERMLRAAFIMQAACTGIFAIICLHFTFVSRRWTPSTLLTDTIPAQPVSHLLWTLNIASLLLIFRTVYHVFEFSTSTPRIQAFFHTHEFMFWACDAAPVLAAFVLLALTHPSSCLPAPYTVFWFREGKLKKLEKKTLQTQTWPGDGWRGDEESKIITVGLGLHGAEAGNGQQPVWPTKAHLPTRS